jgi:hypothetical protein
MEAAPQELQLHPQDPFPALLSRTFLMMTATTIAKSIPLMIIVDRLFFKNSIIFFPSHSLSIGNGLLHGLP